MKIILSRKGFDSGYGGHASPILPDGTLLSLPIPYKTGIKYSDIKYNHSSYLNIIKQLSPKTTIADDSFCHLDPDIRNEVKDRDKDWKGLFGQSTAAQSHLENKKVENDDIFLFFGWFKQTKFTEKGLEFVRGAPDQHIIYGFLQIGKTFHCKEKYDRDVNHPHADFLETNNCIYEASDYLSFDKSKRGYGTFNYNVDLVLTKEGHSRSRWDLPDLFKNIEISYHSNKSFKDEYFQSARIGQEFVIECDEKMIEWTKQLIINNI